MESFLTGPHIVYHSLIAFMTFFIIVLLFILYKKIPNICTTKHEFNLFKQMSTSKKVESFLSELRVLIGADRVSLIRFHNGQEFLPNNPVWKISSDHQVVADGVSYEDIEGVLVSRIPNIIEPLITGETTESGIKIPGPCEKCPNNRLCEGTNNRIIWFDVDKMSGYAQSFLQKRGTSTAYLATINNSDDKVFGVLMVEYIDVVTGGAKILNITQTICKYSTKLRFLFN